MSEEIGTKSFLLLQLVENGRIEIRGSSKLGGEETKGSSYGKKVVEGKAEKEGTSGGSLHLYTFAPKGFVWKAESLLFTSDY